MRTSAGIVLLTILSFGCGGQASSPASPSPVSTAAPASTTGATLNGTVLLTATAADGTAASPLRVQVAGTNLTTTVTPAGQFTLSDVPGGSVQLHFTGDGADASVGLGQPVSPGETVTVTVTVAGSHAEIDSEDHGGDGQQDQIEGLIESLPPTQPAGTLVVAGRTIATDASTVITQGGAARTFADLAVGQRVHVKGHTSGTAFLATRIEIQNDNTTVPVNVNGVVSGLTGTAAAFQFTVNGRQITGDAQTLFYSSENETQDADSTPALTFADLKDGERVEVKGQQRDPTVYAVRIYIDAGGSDNEGEFDAKGPISGLSGNCPALSFTLDGTTVTTDATTTFENAQGCSAIVDGMTLEVEGTKQADGSVLAAKVDDMGDGNGGVSFKGEGAIAGLSGTCPAISFTLGATSVDANASTNFHRVACAALQDGDTVQVKGNWEPGGGRVLATKIER